MQNRIDRLEGLVLSLMTNGAQSAGPTAAAAAISRSQSDSAASSFPTELDRDDDDMIKEEDEGDDSDVDGVTNSLGVLKVDADKGKSLYFGDSHWHLVLADVSILSYFYTILAGSSICLFSPLPRRWDYSYCCCIVRIYCYGFSRISQAQVAQDFCGSVETS
jgi:hypothetical protein